MGLEMFAVRHNASRAEYVLKKYHRLPDDPQKLLHTQRFSDVQKELDIWRQLQHPRVVSLFDFYQVRYF